MNHVLFIVDDLDPLLAGLQAEGLRCWGEIVEWRDTWGRCVYPKDPEGSIVQFNKPRRDTRQVSADQKSRVAPPSTARAWPVTKLESSLARKSAARPISSGVAMRPRACIA